MPSNAGNVPSNASSRTGEGTGQQRSERLRARRDKAGMAQVSGWVPKERRPYAREVLAALARGANSLPPDPEQAATLDTAQAAAAAARASETQARAALAEAEQRGQTLMAELDAARVESEATRKAGRRAEVAAVARVEAAERAREIMADKLRVAELLAKQAQAETECFRQATECFRQAPGFRGRIVRWLIK